MKQGLKYRTARLAVIIWLAWSLANPAAIHSYCSDGAAVPPFLAAGLDPNLLLMIDNSASMYDLAYVKPREEGYCYDGTTLDASDNPVESYSAATSYAGYFDASTYYAYNMSSGEFEAQSYTDVLNYCSGADYYRPQTLCITIDESTNPKTVTAFAGSGNFLNWAAASKLDIQKKILTGGKYDAANSRLVMESRGCLGRRFVKKISVTGVGGGGTYYLTLGIRQPEDSEKTGADDHTTRIEIFDVTADGFDYDSCQAALTELNSDSPNLGQMKGHVEDCMGYSGGSTSDSMTAFNHSLQECWYYNKHGEFQPGSGTVNSIKNDCEKIYDDGIDPTDIGRDDRGYICYGQYGADPPDGYVGRCWEPASSSDPLVCTDRVCTTEPPAYEAAEVCIGGIVHYCSGNYNSNKKTCNKAWLVKQDCTGGGSVLVDGWTDDDGDGGDACVEQAYKDYCGIIEVPEVVDPSDSADDTGNIWNAPAVLIDTGVLSQMGDPLIVIEGHVDLAAAPEGLIQQYADKIRMGAMIFNDDGSLSECSQSDPHILYGCADAGNRDGGRIIAYIDQSDAHTTALVTAVNDIMATSWTPLAEAMYNAIGYYTQTGWRLNAADFLMDASHPDPVTAWCQKNNILIVTEGASTADLNSTVATDINAETDHDGDTEAASCGTLDGSTLLDDLTHYGWRGSEIFGTGDRSNYQNIQTHIVIAGTMRASGTGECDPSTLLEDAAIYGGTTVYQANDPADLQATLEDAFASIRAGAAAGSAASVISASRGGEGAIYQAVFWPRTEIADADPVDWTGEVHALHIDSYGYMFEDTNGDRSLDAGDNQVVFYYDDLAQKTKACINPTDDSSGCSGTSKDMAEVRYLWSASRWLAEITDTNVVLNRDAGTDYISNDKMRYIFTWNDLDNDGSVAETEILDF